jgi:hypothetical protein
MYMPLKDNWVSFKRQIPKYLEGSSRMGIEIETNLIVSNIKTFPRK